MQQQEIKGNQLGIREIIVYLVENYKIQLNVISKITGVELVLLKKFINGQVDMLGLALPIEQLSRFTGVISMLYDGISSVEDDNRIKGIIEYLTDELGISLETIAIYAEVPLQNLKKFMKDANSISYEEKYKIATKSLFLHSMFK